VKETEAITVKNADEEEKFENKISHLQEEFKTSDTRAEFAERSVDKLESTIDGLLEALMNEKMNYRNISEKLDKTLNDMMSMT
jgi:predicted RNase H-like nuclease (RuvC/YqgF family)